MTLLFLVFLLYGIHIANCWCYKIVEFFDVLLAQPTDQHWLFRATGCRRRKRAPQLIPVTSITGEFKVIYTLTEFHLYISVIFRYQSLPDLVSRLSEMHHNHRILSKQNDRLNRKIAALSEVVGMSLDEDSHKDLKEIVNDTLVPLFETQVR